MKLIDRDALIVAVDNGWQPDMMVSEIWDIIDEQPIVDAVPVVRCSECQYWQPPTYVEQEDGSTIGHCTAALNGQQTDACWFCADGTR